MVKKIIEDMAKELGIEKYVIDEKYLEDFENVDEMIESLSNSRVVNENRFEYLCGEDKLYVDLNINEKRVLMKFGFDDKGNLVYEGLECNKVLDETDIVVLKEIKDYIEGKRIPIEELFLI